MTDHAARKKTIEERYGVRDTETGAILRQFTLWDAEQFVKAVDKGRYEVVEWTITTETTTSQPTVRITNEWLSAARVPGYGPAWEDKVKK